MWHVKIRSMVAETVKPAPGRREFLEIQSRLIEDPATPDDFDIDLHGESSPVVPVITVKCDPKVYDSAKGFVCKIQGMRNGRYRLVDYTANDDHYFNSDQLEELHQKAMHCIKFCAPR